VLRITTSKTPQETRFLVEGKLVGQCVGELQKCWESALSETSPGNILVDLSSVSFIDCTGKQLLARMHASGIRFVAIGLLPRCLIEEITTQCDD
jgi:anti-anti-sigma regulatory factor